MKRRVIAGLMAGALMLGGAACAQTDKDIFFRGVEWGLVGNSALEAVEATLPDSSGLKWITIDTNGGSYEAADGHIVYVGGYKCSSSSFVPNGLTVADYPISYVTLRFIPSEVDGVVYDSPEESVYVGATYQFSKKDIYYISLAMSDMRAKLISLYGMPDEDYSLDDPDRGLCVCRWHGGNGASVEIRTEATKAADMDGFILYYICDDVGDRIEQLNGLPLARSVGSVDGL